MFNPTNIVKVSIKAIHLESSKENNVFEDVSREPHEFEKKSKGKGKSNKTTIVKKDEEKPTCSNRKKKGCEEAKFWKLIQRCYQRS